MYMLIAAPLAGVELLINLELFIPPDNTSSLNIALLLLINVALFIEPPLLPLDIAIT